MPCHPLRWILLSLGSLLPATPSRAQFELTDYRIAGFVGPAFFTNASPRPLLLGLSLDAGFFHPKSANVGVGFLVEGGLFHPALSGTANYYFSADAMLARDAPEGADVKLRPFGVAGYSHLFNATSNSISTANALNFGIGADRIVRDDLWLRFEVRDLYTPSTDTHALVLRIGLVGAGSLQ